MTSKLFSEFSKKKRKKRTISNSTHSPLEEWDLSQPIAAASISHARAAMGKSESVWFKELYLLARRYFLTYMWNGYLDEPIREVFPGMNKDHATYTDARKRIQANYKTWKGCVCRSDCCMTSLAIRYAHLIWMKHSMATKVISMHWRKFSLSWQNCHWTCRAQHNYGHHLTLLAIYKIGLFHSFLTWRARPWYGRPRLSDLNEA